MKAKDWIDGLQQNEKIVGDPRMAAPDCIAHDPVLFSGTVCHM